MHAATPCHATPHHATSRRFCSDVNGLLLGRQQSVHGCWHCLHVDLPNSIGEDVDDLLVWCGYDTLAIDFDDPMSHADASSLSDSPLMRLQIIPFCTLKPSW